MAIKHADVKVSGDKGYASEWNADHVIDGNVDFGLYQLIQAVAENRAAYPGGPVKGQIIYKTDTNTLEYWNGTEWIKIQIRPFIVVATDGTGDYDDIQDAIDALPGTGGLVYIKAGTYTVTAMITVNKSNSTIEGQGEASIIQQNGNVVGIGISGENVTLRNLHIKGLRANANNVGVYSSGNSRIHLEGLVVEQCGNTGIMLASTTSAPGYEVYYCRIVKCHVFENVGSGIRLTSGSYSIIRDNFVFNNEQHGIMIYGGFDHTANENIVSGNIIVDNDYSDTTTYDGINLSVNETPGHEGEVNRIIISDNRCYNNDRDEIRLDHANVDRTLVHGNICYGTDHVAAIVDNGTNTLSADNIVA